MKLKGPVIVLVYLAGLIMGLFIWHLIARLIGAIDLIGMLKEALR